MKLVIGGAFQGKQAFAQQKFQMQNGWADGSCCTKDELFAAPGVFQFHEYIRRMTAAGQDTQNFAEELIRENPDLIIVTNELGYGVVPVAALDRAYRENTGRICTKLAAYSSEVYRVVCGIGQVIKGA